MISRRARTGPVLGEMACEHDDVLRRNLDPLQVEAEFCHSPENENFVRGWYFNVWRRTY